tara:strand:- start:300 stop:479 length:180 start_codon:yes stop_codon:yes gene_type:complete
MLPISYIVFPSVPWTSNNTPVDASFAQRATLMGTDSIRGVNLTVYIVDREDTAIYDAFN